jgi:cytochrome oxidase assembly protein ShyY1
MDDNSHFALIEMLFSFGILMALGLWQLVSVRREIAKDKQRAEAAKKDSGA